MGKLRSLRNTSQFSLNLPIPPNKVARLNPCRHVIEALKIVYRNDKIARDERLSAAERLIYHQEHSRATMDDLKAWLERQFEERHVEPNSALGETIAYLLKRWEPQMTLFLREPGDPLDNNLCERALKKAEPDYPGLLRLFATPGTN